MSLFEQKSLLAKLMAAEDLIIRQAKVDTACFDVKNRVLTVPILDKEMSKDVYDLFMGHESAHAIWTPLEGMKKAKNQKVNMSVLNVVEDARIERRIKTKFPGIKTPFINAYQILYSDDFFETEGKDLNEFNFIDRLNLHCKVGASLALKFDEEERKLLEEVENTQTFDDVIEVTKKICEFMKEQLRENPNLFKKKVKVVVHGGEEGDSDDNSSKSEEETEEYDEEIHIDLGEPEGKGEGQDKNEEETDATQASGEEEGDSEDFSSETETGSGSNISEEELEEQIRSFTDDAYKRNENKLFSDGKEKYTYVNVPKFNTSKIMDYKDMFRLLRATGFTANPKFFNEYRKESNKVVSYLVKEFELRKNADQMKRASTAKTGDLNMNRLYSYTFTEDIFKKITVVPQGKSHGLVMYVDWSGSMIKHLLNTIKQLLNLVMFCKKVNIPFEVYAFAESTEHSFMYKPQYKTGDVAMKEFGLINLLSNRMSASEFTYAASCLMKMGGAEGKRTWQCEIPRFMALSGTPLNEAVISAFEIVPEFQKRNRLQIVNTVFLTDGEGCMLQSSYDSMGYSKSENYSHMVIRDPVTRCEEVFERAGSYGMQQTDCFVRLLKQRTNSHVIGFFVGDTKDISYRMGYFFPEYVGLEIQDRIPFAENVKEKFRKDNSVVVTSTGFDDYYILRGNALDTDDEEELTFKENATTRGMVTAFTKYTESKISSRVILNRFIKLIA